ncbi:hypothetical protein [Paenibacillus wulumuqiensis]|uniref:hypothetical protein n=1 Tax=Paenibacillus wulumuqiensis TaxID=1567107 RepID=UPI000698F35D|nr:hypothetical protein [Paenibacillus wulumuqiensis]
MMVDGVDFLYVYSTALFKFLQQGRFRYVCIGVNERSGGRFWLYVKTEELRGALDRYDALKTSEEA